MKIYKVYPDAKYRYHLPQDPSIYRSGMLRYDGRPKLAVWAPPPVYVYRPKLKKGNFSSLGGALVCDEVAVDGLREHLQKSAELLPLPYEGETLYVVNIIACFDLLDQQQTQWRMANGRRLFIDRYVFQRNRIPGAPVFKIPESVLKDDLCYEQTGSAATEFRAAVLALGLTGLTFKELWSDET